MAPTCIGVGGVLQRHGLAVAVGAHELGAIETKHAVGDDEMPGRGNGEKLGHPFDEAQHKRIPSIGAGCGLGGGGGRRGFSGLGVRRGADEGRAQGCDERKEETEAKG
jgi:hypothetical protein